MESDDDGLCAVSSELASGELASLAHATCAFGDSGHCQTDLKLKKKKNLTKCEEKRGNRWEGTGEREQRWERREKNKVKREEREKRIKIY